MDRLRRRVRHKAWWIHMRAGLAVVLLCAQTGLAVIPPEQKASLTGPVATPPDHSKRITPADEDTRPLPPPPAIQLGCPVATPPVVAMPEPAPKPRVAVPSPAPDLGDSKHVSAHRIDLEVALRLAGVDNPTINLAREGIREALAVELASRSLMLPSVNFGGSFNMHRGALQDDPGFLRFPSRQSLYLGAGSGPVGAGTVPVPGVWLFAHLGNAIYEPIAARQRTAARRADADAVDNAVLLQVATAYLELAGAEERLAILRRGQADVAEIVRVTADFAKAGQGAPADANRAAANAQLINTLASEAEGGVAAASARLARLLSLDPSSDTLRTMGGPIGTIRFVAEDTDLDTLLATALRFRPELSAQAAGIAVAQTQVRQERIRPFLPLLAVGYSAGAFGGGSNLVPSDFGPLSGRSDLQVMAVWNVQNLSAGNVSRVRGASAIVGQAMESYAIALNQIRRDVAEAQAAAQTALAQVRVARTALPAAEEGFALEKDRIKLGQGRPIEVLDSLLQLLEARQELLRAIIAFDVAQFQLFVALGGNPAGS
jgi:outer membrane protein TolC